jgi:RND family efflux transporter MFP subunit
MKMSIEIEKFEGESNGHRAIEHHNQARVSTDSEAGTGRKLAIAIAVLAIVMVIGFVIAFMVHRHSENAAASLAVDVADAKPAVDVVFVQPTSRSYPLELPGQTAGWHQSTIFARVDGYVGEWRSDIGDCVKQGQTLAIIDTPDLDQQLNAARAKTAASAAQVQVAESHASITKLTYERWRDSPKGVVSEQEREEKQADYEEAIARLSAAKAQAKLDEADVGRYAAFEEFKNVTAPYDGVITGRKVDVGDLVTAGSSANTTPLYNIAQSNVIRAFVDVPQKAAAEMAVGLEAVATSDQYPGRIFSGKVARSAMSIDPQTRTQRTEVDIPNPDLTLVPGMYVQITFQLNQRGLQQVPAAAILFRPGGLQVAVVNSDNKIELQSVTVAKDNGDTVVLGSGVSAGERVALNLSSAISNGEEVTVNQDHDEPTVATSTAATHASTDSASPSGAGK